MNDIATVDSGGYRYLKSVFQFSGGVAAQPGFAIERAHFSHAGSLGAGFEAIEAHLAALGRPTTALCACELRSPQPFTERGFVNFNKAYVQNLQQFGLFHDGINPVARTNVCPRLAAPAQPTIHAFAYTVPTQTARASFVISGGAEAAEGAGDYHDSIIRLGDTSPEGLRDKLRYVASEQNRRLGALGLAWHDATDVRIYTRHDVGPLLQPELLHHGIGLYGLAWYDASPPVRDCEYEMDARTVVRDICL